MVFFFNNAWVLRIGWCFQKIKGKKFMTRAVIYRSKKKLILLRHFIRLSLFFLFVRCMYLPDLWCVVDILFLFLFFLSLFPSRNLCLPSIFSYKPFKFFFFWFCPKFFYIYFFNSFLKFPFIFNCILLCFSIRFGLHSFDYFF